ncbi:MAG: Holliday junction resolvase RuvX [Ignavibacteria bacterium]|nr:Holliday junction resolvase RuvX [Ignavibacteria bacterium]
MEQDGGNGRGRVLGIDYGSVRIGLAISDPMRIIAGGAGVVPNDRNAIDVIIRMISEREVTAVVVGMPYRADGSRGTIAGEIERFIGQLRERLSLPVETWDEGYTSIRAKETFRQGGMKRKERREKANVDEMAARLLLQDYLETGLG